MAGCQIGSQSQSEVRPNPYARDEYRLRREGVRMRRSQENGTAVTGETRSVNGTAGWARTTDLRIHNPAL